MPKAESQNPDIAACIQRAQQWVSEMSSTLGIESVIVRRHRRGRGPVRATPPAVDRPSWTVEVDDALLGQPSHVQRAVLAHELQHVRFNDVWRPTPTQWRSYLARVLVTAFLAMASGIATLFLMHAGHPWLALASATGTALTLWAFLRLCTRQHQDNDEQQVIELRNDLAAAALVGRSTMTSGLRWIHDRSKWADSFYSIPILGRVVDIFDTHPAAQDRIRAVTACRLDQDLLQQARTFLLYSATHPLRGTRRRRAEQASNRG